MPVFQVDENTKRKAVAVRFCNGVLNNNDQDRVTFKVYTKTDASSKTQTPAKHIVTAQVDGLTYVGKTFGQMNRFPTENCDYYFGVHDKRTGKIQVITADLCQLEPCINDKRDIDDVDLSKSTFREKHNAVIKEFGSGRSQRAVKKQLNNRLEDDVVSLSTKAVVGSRHTQAQAAEISESVKTEATAIPLYNKDASTPDEVYRLNDIIGSDVLLAMSQPSGVFMKSTSEDISRWRTEKTYYEFILAKLEMLSVREDARKLQSQCLMYLQYLMQVYVMKHHQLRLKNPLPQEWPVAVKNHILKTFTLEIEQPGKRSQRCVPARLRDLLLSHIVVLCLKLSQFDVTLLPLMNDLNLSQKRMTTHVSALGCTVKKVKSPAGEDVFKAVLTIPLKFPEIKGKIAKNRIF